MQIYLARIGKNRWETHVVTNWKSPVHFSGHGSMPFIGIALNRFELSAPGILGVGYHHKDYGRGLLQIDASTLKPIKKTIRLRSDFPPALERVTSHFSGMGIRRTFDDPTKNGKGYAYMLQWESLVANRERQPSPPLPPPSMLRLHVLKVTE